MRGNEFLPINDDERHWVVETQCRRSRSLLASMKWAAPSNTFSFCTTRSFQFCEKRTYETIDWWIDSFHQFFLPDNRPCSNHSGGYFHPLLNDLLIWYVAYLYSSHLNCLISSLSKFCWRRQFLHDCQSSWKLQETMRKSFIQLPSSPPSYFSMTDLFCPESEELLDSEKFRLHFNDIQGVEHHQLTNEPPQKRNENNNEIIPSGLKEFVCQLFFSSRNIFIPP